MKRCFIMVLLCVMLSGCTGQTALRDEVVVTALGIHQKGDDFSLSIQAIEPLKVAAGLSEQDDTATTVYEATGKSVSSALHAFLGKTGRKTYILQNRLVVVNTAQQSVFDTLNYLIENTNGHGQVAVAVCRDDPKTLLDLSPQSDAIPVRYVTGLLQETAEWGGCVYRRLSDVRCAASGMYDAVLPIVNVQNGTVTCDGTALFKDGVLVGELDTAQTLGLSLLLGEVPHTLYTQDGITYTLSALKTKRTVTQDGQRFSYAFSVAGEIAVTEQTGNTKINASAVEGYITACMRDALRVLDAVDCDSLGLARYTAQTYPVMQETARSQLKHCDKAVSVSFKW